MTDVPEHLLARSRERRAALGLGGDEAGAAATPPAGGEARTAPAPAAAGGGEITPAAPAPVPEVVPVRPDPPYVAAAKARPRIPVFVAPVLAVLPVFAFIYWGALTPKPAPEDPVLALGAEIYASQCSSCHGATGGGGVGRPLDEVVTTFPDPDDHIAWVTNGNVQLAPGTEYGVNRRAKQDGYATMPAFGESLSEEEIAAVVRYERQEFGGEAPPAEDAEGTGVGTGGGGSGQDNSDED